MAEKAKIVPKLCRRLSLIILLVALLVAAVAPVVAQRNEKLEFADIAKMLALQEGSRVADVGAGAGNWTMLLSKHVGPNGRVFATDVKLPQVENLRGIAARLEYSNVTAILGSEDDTGLPAECCDAILLRLVYHAFDKPEEMRRSMLRALRTGGRILIVDFEPENKVLMEQMENSGSKTLETIERWQGQAGVYAVLFERKGVSKQGDSSPK